MIQSIISAPQLIETRNVPIPEPLPGQILIKIERCGICGSDIHAYYGKHPFISLPVVPGHEFSGTVVKIGEGVTDFPKGCNVTVMPQIYCGQCYNCMAGRYNICESLKVIGCQAPGSMQEYLAVDAKLALKLPDEISFDIGAMLEPAAVGIHACKHIGTAGKRVLVLGAGTIGNLIAQAAKALGAKETMITDMSEYRLELAKKCGIDHTVQTRKQNLADAVKKAFGTDADIIIEAVGVQETVNQAIEIARKGSDIVIAGVFGSQPTVNMGLVQDKELKLTGTLMYTKEDWADAIKFSLSGQILLTPLISRRFRLNEVKEAFTYIENNREKAVKVLLEG